MMRRWIVVASADHVRRGVAGGFVQVNHGKLAPLKRIEAGDGVVAYSPTRQFGTRDGLQAFTALGIVRDGEPYAGEMGGGLQAARRDVDWKPAVEVPIRPLLGRLELTRGMKSWGARLRFGLVEIGDADFHVIADAMGVDLHGRERSAWSG